MSNDADREKQRQLYRQNDITAASFIPAKPKIDIYAGGRIFRVCAYCRVSTDNDAQLSSYELQQEHYKQLVGNHPNWDLKHIYADEGISGTSLKNRDDFNRMIEACRRGEYDLIVTKSVSRFARNLVDCISLVRQLKRQTPPVGVFFETDNLNTLSEDSELMLSFLATFAQEESVKKSESMNWSLQQRFKSGKLLTPELLGYERPKDVSGHYIKYARLEIIESEARIVRFIFDAYLAGHSIKEIAALLTDIGCKTKTGSDVWSEGSITYILQNERYCGNVLTWKTFTADMFEHRHKRNRQDRDQYLYTDHHDAIISIETYEAAQQLMDNHRHRALGALTRIRVIDDGVFRGYIPVNHHWVNDDPSRYYDASNSVNRKELLKRIRKNQFSAFDFQGYQVVRGQFLSMRPECPCITFLNGRIIFNIFCIRKFADVKFIQLLLHPTERKIAIRPCKEEDPYHISWCLDPDKPRSSKALSCPHFAIALYRIMEWNPDYAYRVRGTYAARNIDEIIVFNLANAEPATFLIEPETSNKRYARRTTLCPDEWEFTFGQEFYDHAMENSFFYLDDRSGWKASDQGHEFNDGKSPRIPTTEELQQSLHLIQKGDGIDGTDPSS